MIEHPDEYAKLSADALEVMETVKHKGPFPSCVPNSAKGLTFEGTKEMLRRLQAAGMPRLDRKTALVHMLETPLGAAFGADGGRAWAVLQP